MFYYLPLASVEPLTSKQSEEMQRVGLNDRLIIHTYSRQAYFFLHYHSSNFLHLVRRGIVFILRVINQ